MGNFSRDTFHPEKGYVGVRLQQGVPLVDADWNEQNDVIRQEVYDGLSAVVTGGAARIDPHSAEHAFRVMPGSAPNDLSFLAGSAVVAGRSIRMPVRWTAYSEQPWTDPGRAAHDGVAVLPPLTTPASDRSDLVYLDVWEREVGRAEDPEIVNPVIGVETAVRLKREAAVRVAEGSTTVPAAPAGHWRMPIALLHRTANEAVIKTSEIEEQRSFLATGPALRHMSLTPGFLPVALAGHAAWEHSGGGSVAYALKPPNANVIGFLPLPLPHYAKIESLSYTGYSGGGNAITLALARTAASLAFDTTSAIIMEESQTFPTSGIPIGRTVSVPPGRRRTNLHVVNNLRYSYALYARATSSTGGGLSLFNLRVDYQS
ncbi:DUF6519 domain-containing protein [Streptomyces chartreusis]|uniref:DUF6519 domain-containing protein n=1 Tax=Streptomyces chartreusis TaxID=1969 RepID=UPI003864DD6C|nr:DUF6519 domain-containing protein [Streptomyces chartreusis]